MSNQNNKKVLKKIKIRNTEPRDYESITSIQLKCFPQMKPWSSEQFENILKVFPEGQVCIEYNNQVIASCCSLIIDGDKYSETSSWHELTGNGYINNHDPKGDTLYGMEIMVDPDYQNMKLARRLYDWRKRFAVTRNLEKISIGGRLPNYYKHKDKINVYDYVGAVTDRKIFDPVLTTQLANGFALKKVGSSRVDLQACKLEYSIVSPK